MDELAYSLNGQNYHFGTPVNKAAPQSVPGGSSSGSAVRFPVHPCMYVAAFHVSGSNCCSDLVCASLHAPLKHCSSHIRDRWSCLRFDRVYCDGAVLEQGLRPCISSAVCYVSVCDAAVHSLLGGGRLCCWKRHRGLCPHPSIIPRHFWVPSNAWARLHGAIRAPSSRI